MSSQLPKKTLLVNSRNRLLFGIAVALSIGLLATWGILSTLFKSTTSVSWSTSVAQQPVAIATKIPKYTAPELVPPPPYVTITPTVGSPSPTPTLSGFDAWQTVVAARTPKPTSTPAMGWLECGPPAEPWFPYFKSCWRGMVGGQIINLAAGVASIMEGAGALPGADASIGVLHISGEPTHSWTDVGKYYITPVFSGTIEIKSIVGKRINLVTEDGSGNFVFDMDKRQWVPPLAKPDSVVTAGSVECPSSAIINDAWLLWCWRGKIDGEPVGLAAGSDYRTGVLRIDNYNKNGRVTRSESFTTPKNLGLVYLEAIKGKQVTLRPYDPQLRQTRFVFDLGAREWILPKAPATPLIKAGLIPCESTDVLTGPYGLYSCWHGELNGELVSVGTAGSVLLNAPSSVVVFAGPDFDAFAPTTEIYPVPQGKGGNWLRIESVHGTLFTLAAEDGDGPLRPVFVFDLATRQFVPVPTATPTP